MFDSTSKNEEGCDSAQQADELSEDYRRVPHPDQQPQQINVCGWPDTGKTQLDSVFGPPDGHRYSRRTIDVHTNVPEDAGYCPKTNPRNKDYEKEFFRKRLLISI